MDDIAQLKPALRRLKMTGMADNLEDRIKQAMKEKWSYVHFLHAIFTEESERRDHKQSVLRLARSNLDPQKTLETFDFTFNPRIHENTVRQLSECLFIEKHENIFIVGQSGVGKSHLAQAIGHEACRRGHDTLFYSTVNLFQWLNAGRADNSLSKRMKQVLKAPLLILDDFGLKPLTEVQQSDLYDLIDARYEKGATIVTSNRDFNEWPAVFKNPLMASAAMDRLVHRATKIVIEGKSFRLNEFGKRSKKQGNQ